MHANLQIVADRSTTVSLPDPFGALLLKAAAHGNDRGDRARHLADAAILLACIDDPFERRPSSGGDRARLLYLRRHLADPLDLAWMRLPDRARSDAQSALDILARTRPLARAARLQLASP